MGRVCLDLSPARLVTPAPPPHCHSQPALLLAGSKPSAFPRPLHLHTTDGVAPPVPPLSAPPPPLPRSPPRPRQPAHPYCHTHAHKEPSPASSWRPPAPLTCYVLSRLSVHMASAPPPPSSCPTAQASSRPAVTLGSTSLAPPTPWCCQAPPAAASSPTSAKSVRLATAAVTSACWTLVSVPPSLRTQGRGTAAG